MESITRAMAAQLTQLNHQQVDMQQATLLQIGATESYFYQAVSNQLTTLPIGYQLVADKFFQHTPPNPDDLEYGINYLEDEIERAIPQIGQIELLLTQQDFLIEIAKLAGITPAKTMVLPREQMERLFGYYAEISQGRPPLPSEPDVSQVFYAKLLILREYMHHLKVLSLTLAPANEANA